jgi:hypothetical protein
VSENRNASAPLRAVASRARAFKFHGYVRRDGSGGFSLGALTRASCAHVGGHIVAGGHRFPLVLVSSPGALTFLLTLTLTPDMRPLASQRNAQIPYFWTAWSRVNVQIRAAPSRHRIIRDHDEIGRPLFQAIEAYLCPIRKS